ncbi:extracellular solute-binding protein [Kribbella sp. WER1]
MDQYSPSRRAILLGGLALTAGLAGCSNAKSSSGGLDSAKANPPAFVPFDGSKPDLPGDLGKGIQPGFFHYPATPPATVTGAVGTGAALSLLVSGPPVGSQKSSNQWWQLLDKKLGVDLQVTQVDSLSYASKFTVDVAGGNYEDMMQILSAPNEPKLLESKFVDLGDHLGGDNIKKYPNLAALPPQAWTAGTVNGHLFGISQPRSIAGQVMNTRQDILDKLGLGKPELTSGADFLALCKEVTKPAEHRWAMGTQPVLLTLRTVLEMMGAPKGWQVKDGKFTRDIELDVYLDALDELRKWWQAGIFHPDSFTASGSYQTWWYGGTTVIYMQSFAGWAVAANNNPTLKFGVLKLPKWGGGGTAVKHLESGNYLFTAIKKAPKERVEEILRVWNYLSAPFGSQEYLDVNYGVAGHDYKLTGSDPVLTADGTKETLAGLSYIGSTRSTAIYVPNQEDLVRAAYEFQSAVVPTGISDPTDVLYSPTQLGKGAGAEEPLIDTKNDIVQGRKPVSAFKDAVQTWRSAVGDTIRHEYEQAYSSNGGR